MTLKRKVIAGERPPLPAEWPDAVRNVISEAWVGEPKLRPRFDELSKDLDSYLEKVGQRQTITTRTRRDPWDGGEWLRRVEHVVWCGRTCSMVWKDGAYVSKLSSVDVTVAFIVLTLDAPPFSALAAHRYITSPFLFSAPLPSLSSSSSSSSLSSFSSSSSFSSFLSFSSSSTVHEAKLADISTVEDSNTSGTRNSNAPVFIPRNSTTGGGLGKPRGKPRHGNLKRVKSKRVSSQDRADPEGKVE